MSISAFNRLGREIDVEIISDKCGTDRDCNETTLRRITSVGVGGGGSGGSKMVIWNLTFRSLSELLPTLN